MILLIPLWSSGFNCCVISMSISLLSAFSVAQWLIVRYPILLGTLGLYGLDFHNDNIFW